MRTTEQSSLTDALNECQVTELPSELSEDSDIWLVAIVKVRKCNGKANYAKAVNDGYGNPKIVKDFGTMAAIVRIDKIYPVEYLRKSAIPKIRDAKQFVTYLSMHGEDKERIAAMLPEETKGNIVEANEELNKIFLYYVIQDNLKQFYNKYL